MKKTVNLAASVRQRLLNLATERKEDFALVLNRYGLERFLYRLSVSPHRDSFVLKGALLLQVWTEETYRPTRDLDLLGTGMSNVSYRKVFSEVCSEDIEDDGLSFLSETIRIERIRDEAITRSSADFRYCVDERLRAEISTKSAHLNQFYKKGFFVRPDCRERRSRRHRKGLRRRSGKN